MRKEYEITSCEYYWANVDYKKSDILPGAIEAIEDLESIEGSFTEWETFDNLEEALAAFNSTAYDPEFDGDGYDLRVYELIEVIYDDDGVLFASNTIADKWPDEVK